MGCVYEKMDLVWIFIVDLNESERSLVTPVDVMLCCRRREDAEIVKLKKTRKMIEKCWRIT